MAAKYDLKLNPIDLARNTCWDELSSKFMLCGLPFTVKEITIPLVGSLSPMKTQVLIYCFHLQRWPASAITLKQVLQLLRNSH